jgi:hypothetical protein
MEEKHGIRRRALVLGVLIACAVLVGTAVALDTVTCPCERYYADNATAGYYGPGMMGGIGYGGAGYGVVGGYGPGYGMMDDAGITAYGFMPVVGIFFILFLIVWLIAGILLVFWLIRQLQAGKPPS